MAHARDEAIICRPEQIDAYTQTRYPNQTFEDAAMSEGHADLTCSEETSNGRLNSWKEIAGYLGRGIRSVQRWESEEGLPVHRLSHDKRGTVYAYKYELDSWWESRRVALTAEEAETSALPEPTTATHSFQSRRPILIKAAAGLAFLTSIGIALYFFTRPAPKSAPTLRRLTHTGNLGWRTARSRQMDALSLTLRKAISGFSLRTVGRGSG